MTTIITIDTERSTGVDLASWGNLTARSPKSCAARKLARAMIAAVAQIPAPAAPMATPAPPAAVAAVASAAAPAPASPAASPVANPAADPAANGTPGNPAASTEAPAAAPSTTAAAPGAAPAGAESARPAVPDTPAATGKWAVQLGAFAVQANAETLRDEVGTLLAKPEARKLPPASRTARIEFDGHLHHVLVGGYGARDGAQKLARRLQQLLGRDTTIYQHN